MVLTGWGSPKKDQAQDDGIRVYFGKSVVRRTK
jgi:hypothetical protein